MRPLILLTNDDGFNAPGLRALGAALSSRADVVVCAPELNQSATSHSLSLHRILRLRLVEAGVYALDGTPADCVYVALHAKARVLERRPDMVVSGMNHGLNLGVDVFYSGTVAAAREGALRGIPSIAVSSHTKAPLEAAAAVGAKIALAMFDRFSASGASSRTAPLLNVNIPLVTMGGPPGQAGLPPHTPGESWPIRATRLGARVYDQEVIFREDPRGREYLWIGGADPRHDPVPGSDTEAFDEGCVSITPLTLDLSDPSAAGFVAEVAADAARPTG